MFEKLAILGVSRRCNHACAFCSEGDVHTGEVVPFEVIADTLSRLRDKGYDSVNFMGGETTLRSDLPELLDLVRQHGLAAALTTNGTRLSSRRFAEAVLPRLDAIEISLPSHDVATYRAVTGRDHLRHVSRALEHLRRELSAERERPLRVSVNVVVCRLNPGAPAGVARMLAAAGLAPHVLLHLIRARRHGRAAERPELLLDLGECAKSFREGVAAARELGLRAMYRGLPPCALADEVAHNFAALEWQSHPDNAFLNQGLLRDGQSIDDNVGLDRVGRGFPEPCGGCSLLPVCPGVDPDVAEPETEVRPCGAERSPEWLIERLRDGPLAELVPFHSPPS